mmetsp:Transcript_5137/g.6705  ORF Transcript_5137/g.6705 Transcript_5137/m.6705 type:complete len:115 (+) Transcript_5137:964-1308(+)
MRSKVSLALMGVVLATGLTACSSSDDDNQQFSNAAYVQFYNGSSNSAQTIMRGTEETQVLGGASYGDSTSLFSTEGGFTEIEFYRTDSDDEEVIIETREIDLPTGQKNPCDVNG